MKINLKIARREYERGAFLLAVKFWQYALAEDPDDAFAWLTLDHSLLKLHDRIGSIDALENAAVLQPLDTASRVELAIAYRAVGRKSLSRDLLMMVATSEQATAPEMLRIAAALEAVDEPILAMEACRQAGKISPETPEVHYQMGYYAQMTGHPASVSEALMRHAIDLDPANIHFRIGLASLLIRLGRQCEAIAVLERAIPSRLDEITCERCLRRIANLFFDRDDLHRARLCAVRLADIQSSAATSSLSPDTVATP